MHSVGRLGIERRREYSGEDQCRRLLEWLNDPASQPNRNTVLAILDTYFELKRGWEVTRGPDESRATYRGNQKEKEHLHHKLESLCHRYMYHPYFYPCGFFVRSTWLPAKGRRGGAGARLRYYDDSSAVLDISAIADLGLIDRLKKCTCGKWLFAKFEHQRFCSVKCREKAFRSDPTEKAKRREWARRYYWLQKNKNVK